MTRIGRLPTSKVLDVVAPDFGFAVLPSIIQVFEVAGPFFGLNSLPSHIQVLLVVAPLFGLTSFPERTQVLLVVAPFFGFNSLPSQTQLLGQMILFDILHALKRLKSASKIAADNFLTTAFFTVQKEDV